MTFFHDMVEIMSKIAVFDRFLAVTAQNFQNFQKKMSFSNSWLDFASYNIAAWVGGIVRFHNSALPSERCTALWPILCASPYRYVWSLEYQVQKGTSSHMGLPYLFRARPVLCAWCVFGFLFFSGSYVIIHNWPTACGWKWEQPQCQVNQMMRFLMTWMVGYWCAHDRANV